MLLLPHVATWVEQLQEKRGGPGVKQQLAAVRMLFDWLIIGQVLPSNPASAVRGPTHVVKTGKTPVLDGREWRRLVDAIPTETVRDLRDRALIATLTYSFARVTAALKMKVEDLRPRGVGWELRLHKKGGKHHVIPCHHVLAEMLHAYIAAAGLAEQPKGWLFRTAKGWNATRLADKPMKQDDAWLMVRRRAKAAGIEAPIGCHTFRATGITAYLENGGTLEHAPGDGRARKPSHHQALSPDQGTTDARRDRTDQVVTARGEIHLSGVALRPKFHMGPTRLFQSKDYRLGARYQVSEARRWPTHRVSHPFHDRKDDHDRARRGRERSDLRD